MGDLYNTILIVCGMCSVTLIILVILGIIKSIIEGSKKIAHTMKCPYCRTRISARVAICPYCEKEVKK